MPNEPMINNPPLMGTQGYAQVVAEAERAWRAAELFSGELLGWHIATLLGALMSSK